MQYGLYRTRETGSRGKKGGDQGGVELELGGGSKSESHFGDQGSGGIIERAVPAESPFPG